MKAAFTKFLVVFKIFDLERKQKSMYVLKKTPKTAEFLGKKLFSCINGLAAYGRNFYSMHRMYVFSG